MTFQITVITPDMEVHVAGCRDLTNKRAYRQSEGQTTYSGETLVEAIIAADTDLADMFGQDVYEADPAETPWTVVSCTPAPCFVKAVKAAGISFGDRGRPEATAKVRRTRKLAAVPAVPSRHCSGAPVRGIPAHETTADQFTRNARGPEGLDRVCRSCKRQYAAAKAA